LFSNIISGARASSMMYSLVETAKANNLIPFDYLRHALETLSEPFDNGRLSELLP
jgi:hypothetical protein